MLGIYQELDIEQYHSADGLSRSRFMDFIKSPFHYWKNHIDKDAPIKEPTEAMILGNAFHTYVLEPDTFDMRYAVAPMVDRRTTKGKEEYASFITANANKIIISQKTFETIHYMANSVHQHSQAKSLLNDGLIEHSIFWRDPHTNLLCKTRPDIWHENMTVDLKSIDSADEHHFIRAMVKHGYHIQSAFNYEGIFHATENVIKDHAFICCEKDYPYAVAVYILEHETVEVARSIMKNNLLRFKECSDTGIWPGYETKVISLPTWALN